MLSSLSPLRGNGYDHGPDWVNASVMDPTGTRVARPAFGRLAGGPENGPRYPLKTPKFGGSGGSNLTPWQGQIWPEIGRNRPKSGGFRGGPKTRIFAKIGQNFPKFPKSGNPKKTPKIPRPPENRMSKLFVFPDFPVPNGRVIKYPQKCTQFLGFPGGGAPPKIGPFWTPENGSNLAKF